MCGIVGVLDLSESPLWPDRVQSALDEIRYRGPDGSAVKSFGGLTLGHVRLAIVDLTTGGAQPMRRGNLCVVFNGEIYNFLELRNELKRLGSRFRTESDTEVLLAAYEQWGMDCVTRFDGMWAFALADLDRRMIFCSRDRFGEKPFFYSLEDGLFRFASEPIALRPLGLELKANLTATREFIALDLQTDPAASFFQGVHSLPPATNLVVSLDTAEPSTELYYRPGTLSIFPDLENGAVVGELFREELRTAVARRLRTDVPVGMLLSGGVDSSLLAAVAAPEYSERSGKSLIALTSSTGVASNDESPNAEATASALGMTWVRVDSGGPQTRAILRRTARIHQRPIRSTSVAAGALVMSEAHERGLKVLIDGQGADESWLGYVRYAIAVAKALPLRERIGHLRQSRARSGMGYLQWVALASYFSLPAVAAARNISRLRVAGIPSSYSWMRQAFGENVSSVRDSLPDLRVHELTGPHLSELLEYEDRNSMAFSIESRLPYLSYRLVELALSCPPDLLMFDGWSKWPLRDALSETVVADRAWQTKKIGFEGSPTAFDRNDPEVQSMIGESAILGELMDLDGGWRRLPERFVWRLYSVALWEEALHVAS